MPKLVEVAIAKALRLYIEAEEKWRELIEAHKLRMDRLESMIDCHRKELASLKDRVEKIEKISGGSRDISSLKADLDECKKEMTSLRSTYLSTFFDGLEDSPLKVDVAMILDKGLSVDVLGDGGEEN
ncbi:MAG: hypothetical protein Q8853_02510 [Candidatus Phytoplasma australasiaticum]|nr:hypothetical protein [Candidatus Phytoplasma australasiaticum]